MSKAYRLALACLIICVFGLVAGDAQRARPDPKLPPPDADGYFPIKGTVEDIPFSELIAAHVETSGKLLVYDPKRIQGSVTVTAPKEGRVEKPENLLRIALVQWRLVMITTGDFEQIIPLAEAITAAQSVTREELSTVPDFAYVSLTYHLKNADPNTVRVSLQSMTTRPGVGSVLMVGEREPTGVNALIICDFAYNLRNLVTTLDQLDSEIAKESTVIKLQHVKVEEIASALESAAGSGMSVGFDAANNRVVLTGTELHIKRMAALVAALDTKE